MTKPALARDVPPGTAADPLEAMLESIAEGILGVDVHGRCTFANRAAATMLGYERERLLGSELHGLVHPRTEDGQPCSRMHCPILRPFRADESSRSGRETLRRSDGTPLPVEFCTSPLVFGDEPGAAVAFSDATPRRRAERYLGAQQAVTVALAESASEEDAAPRILAALGETMGWGEFGAYWYVVDDVVRCRWTWTHPDAEADFGAFRRLSEQLEFARGDGLPGRAWQLGSPTWVDIDEALAAGDRFPRAVAAAALGLRGGIAFPIASGDTVLGVVEFFGRSLAAPDPELTAMMQSLGAPIGQFIERKRAEREADRVKEEFLSLVSHELRTPLSSVIGYLELLDHEEPGPLNEDQRRFIDVIGRNARRLLALVGDLLLVTEIEADRLRLRREPIDLAALAEEAVDAVSRGALAKRIDVRLAVAARPTVAGDPSRLGQVLDNLLSNAVKFTPEAGSVTVAVEELAGRARFEVRDTGVGIPATDRDRVFARFYRSAAASKDAVPGTGLGLSITKALVEAHGGTIEVSSEEGCGTTFRVELPVASAAPEPALAGQAEVCRDER
jgi:PAS domain S-box-containing protein